MALARRRPGKVCVVVSDITRPIPYAAFLPRLLARVEAAGVPRRDIQILVATGMHRPSTPAERIEMLGARVAAQYEMVDHRADDEDELASVPGRSASGRPIRLNRHLVAAGFRLATGLVEPHFMAGFSGGRKAICPGCASLDTVRHFHGAEFLADPRACHGVLDGNPLHLEALSVARALGVDFTVNVVMDRERRIVAAFAGELEAAHAAACDFVRRCACPVVEVEADVAVTSSGGHPLDATFYQCVKGFVSCLPAVRSGGTIVALGGCAEGVGSPEYRAAMERFPGARWREFLEHIRRPGVFDKDQWQYQMHARALERVGEGGLVFISPGLDTAAFASIPVRGVSVAPDGVRAVVQRSVDEAAEAGLRLALFPEGPYCAPLPAKESCRQRHADPGR
jgi:nickel-dependent lactate racemase